MDFDGCLKQKYDIVSAWLEELMPVGEGYHKLIFDSMQYSVKNGGKRIRPILCAAVCEMLGEDINAAKYFACALEFIHTYSLIHDDLPCMDNDDLRRGKPTNHKIFGDAVAVLAGDGLLTYAFYIASKAHTKRLAEAVNVLAKYAGCDGMIGGQVIDMEVPKNLDQLIDLHMKKTGALICCSAHLGAIAADADEQAINSIVAYSRNLGLAFQIKDDILDVTGNESILGKPVGSDEREKKGTFVTFFGLKGANEKVIHYTNKAKESLEIFGNKAEFLLRFADKLLERNY